MSESGLVGALDSSDTLYVLQECECMWAGVYVRPGVDGEPVPVSESIPSVFLA